MCCVGHNASSDRVNMKEKEVLTLWFLLALALTLGGVHGVQTRRESRWSGMYPRWLQQFCEDWGKQVEDFVSTPWILMNKTNSSKPDIHEQFVGREFQVEVVHAGRHFCSHFRRHQ